MDGGDASVWDVFEIVFSRRPYVVAGLVVFPLTALFYAWAAQVLIIDTSGVSWLVEPDVIVAIVILAGLMAVTIPLQIYAAHLLVVQATSVGSAAFGVLIGTASMSCCAPVILPALLSLLGFAGTTILSVNLEIHRYFIPLALLGAILLSYSAVSTAASLGRVCRLSDIVTVGNGVITPE